MIYIKGVKVNCAVEQRLTLKGRGDIKKVENLS